MPKIPVGHTVEAAYRFAFKQFFAVLGIMWFPYLVVIAVSVALAAAMLPGVWHAADEGTFPPAEIPGLIGLAVLFVLGMFVAGAMVRVGLMRRALEMQTGWVFVYFSFGAPVWRMLGAMILAALIILAIALASAAGVGIVWGISHAVLGEAVSGILTGIAAVVAVLFYLYAAVRLFFFLPAVVVAEEQIGLGRAWSLGRANFWRIIVVFLASFIPVMILFGVLSALVSTAVFVPTVEPTTLHDAIRQIHGQLAAALNPLTIVVDIAYFTVLAGLGTGAIAGAYRAIVPSGAGQQPAPLTETPHT